jgi:adenylate kinase
VADANASSAGGGLRLVLLGPPGSGKGTQAAILAENLGVPAISTGKMLRRAVDSGTELGERVESIMSRGALVDDATMAEVVRERLARDDARGGYLLDGYPRTLAQAGTLGRILEESGQVLDAVVLIDVPEDVLVERALARQRADDTEEVVRRRLEIYREKTEPLIEYYKGLGLLRRVDGDRSIADVSAGIREALEARA